MNLLANLEARQPGKCGRDSRVRTESLLLGRFKVVYCPYGMQSIQARQETGLPGKKFCRARHSARSMRRIGISADWHENFDVAVLAIYMSVPKEGPSAGIAILTGIVSALKNVPVRHDIAMTGELTIMGRVLPVGGIQQKIRAAFEAGVREVLLPADNMNEAMALPQFIRDGITLTPVENAQQVLAKALLPINL